MKKYRHHPVLVEATQWFPSVEIEDVVERGVDDEVITYFDEKGVMQQGACLFTKTEKIYLLKQGQWVVTEEDGNKYICDDLFFKKYFECINE